MKVSGTIQVPGDKSISHRALILAALGDGASHICGVLDSADVQSTASVLRALGADIPELSDDFQIVGTGVRGLVTPRTELDCGNSGTTARLIAGAIAGNDVSARLVGDESLSRRPMRRISDPLTAMGATFEFDGPDGLPFTMTGSHLRSVDWESSISSAQVKSAILLAGLTGGRRVSVTEPSKSRDHTERMLRAMGAPVEVVRKRVEFNPPKTLTPLDIQIPGDPSSAAFFVAAAVLADEGELVLENVCINPTRTGFFMILLAAGAIINYENERFAGGEMVADVVVRASSITDLDIDSDDVVSMIDEIPLLACVAAAAGVGATITGASELRVKESDRISVVALNLQAIGAEVEELPDGLRIIGGSRALKGTVATHGDHRIAMAFGVLASLTGGAVTLDERDSAAVSYPGFWNDLERVLHA